MRRFIPGPTRFQEVCFKIDSEKEHADRFNTDIAFEVGGSSEDATRGHLRLTMNTHSTGGRVRIDCTAVALLRTKDKDVTISDLQQEELNPVARSLFDRVRAVVAALTLQMGFEPFFLPDMEDLDSYKESRTDEDEEDRP